MIYISLNILKKLINPLKVICLNRLNIFIFKNCNAYFKDKLK